jgi:hypothetical protein
MIATTIHRIGRSAKTTIAGTIDRALAHKVRLNLTVGTLDKFHFTGLHEPESKNVYQLRTFSTQQVGTVTKTLHALDMEAVRQIKLELMEVDANSDGRYARSGTK